MKRETLLESSPQSDLTPLSSGLLQRKCACGTHTMSGACDDCEKKKSSLQRKATSDFESHGVPNIVHEVLGSSGQPLEGNTRGFMESRFGYDFSGVRVHTDDKAAASAQAVDSLAYTVGRDIVFGGGQYRPGTTEGQRLLGHELTHVVQQGRSGVTSAQPSLKIDGAREPAEQEADSVANRVVQREPIRVNRPGGADLQPARSGLIQRTPAPPTLGSATATRDLSRIRIDAVPDFVASSLTAPRVVNAHINDPSVVHMTWLLYNPSDQMMTGSFSTTPGNANSTTAPFSLQPSHFAGTGFVSGRYLLRCVGLNAAHQPVVYADRDFNVLSADLTTNTALPTTYGELTFTKYGKTDANRPSVPRFTVDVELKFLPTTAVTCGDVVFMQSMQNITSEGVSRQVNTNPEQDARKTPLAWSIDRVAGAPSPFYIAGRLPSGAVADIPGWGKAGAGGAGRTDATLIDQPSSAAAPTMRFESCAICRSGGNRGQVYGCATWGFTANNAGQVTLMPRGFRQMPSDQFEEARVAWNTWRTSVPAATRPAEAPALRSP